MSVWKIFTDGGSRSNPGAAALGVWIVDETNQPVYSLGEYLGIKTNNEAEYEAFIRSAEWVVQQINLPHSLEWYLDSQLVVQQLNKNWKIKEPRLQELAKQAWRQLSNIKIPVKISYVPREQNQEADALVNQALDGQT